VVVAFVVVGVVKIAVSNFVQVVRSGEALAVETGQTCYVPKLIQPALTYIVALYHFAEIEGKCPTLSTTARIL